MIIRRKWTIKNETKDKVFCWIADLDDKSYLIRRNDLGGWIEAGKTIELEVPGETIKIGFRKGTIPLFDGWFAEPVEMRTNQDVRLTKDNEITYRTGSVPWNSPDNGKPVFFISPAQANNLPRQVVLAGLGKIPAVGQVLATITGAIWSEIKDDAQSLIAASESRMRDWVRGKIDDFDSSLMERKLNALRRDLRSFQATQDPHSKRTKLIDCLSTFNDAMSMFVGSDDIGSKSADEIAALQEKYVTGTVALAVEIASLHIALLRERVVFREVMEFPPVDWKLGEDELSETITLYQAFFARVAIPMEIKWRDDSMKRTTSGASGRQSFTIEDAPTRQVHRFSDAIKGNQRNTHNSVLNRDYYLEQANNSFTHSLQANVADTSALWTLMDPNQAGARPIDLKRITWIGPCTGLVNKGGNEHGAVRTQLAKASGVITKIDVRAHDRVDYIKMYFQDGKTAEVGNPKGGSLSTVTIPDGAYIKAAESWWDWELSGLRFHMSDGSKTAIMGRSTHPKPNLGPNRNKPEQPQNRQYAELPHHRLVGFKAEGKPADKTGIRVGNAMFFAFQPVPDFYDIPSA